MFAEIGSNSTGHANLKITRHLSGRETAQSAFLLSSRKLPLSRQQTQVLYRLIDTCSVADWHFAITSGAVGHSLRYRSPCQSLTLGKKHKNHRHHRYDRHQPTDVIYIHGHSGQHGTHRHPESGAVDWLCASAYFRHRGVWLSDDAHQGEWLSESK
jgi:hypothetical protein